MPLDDAATPDDAGFIELGTVDPGGDGAAAMTEPPEGPRATTSMSGRRAPLTAPNKQFDVLDAADLENAGSTGTGHFREDLADAGWDAFTPAELEIVQINVGKLCNMTCKHCHVDSGPDRTEENMDRQTVEQCLDAIDESADSGDRVQLD